MEVKDKLYLRYQESLPTLQEAEDLPDMVHSDHLPILIYRDPSNTEPTILSWNVSETGMRGFAPPDQEIYLETTEEKKGRCDRILGALKKILKSEKPGFIALQGIKVEGDLLGMIEKTLIEDKNGSYFYKEGTLSFLRDYSLAFNQDLHSGFSCITLFRKDKYKLDESLEDEGSSSVYPKTPIAGYSCKFKRMDDDSKVVIHNVCYTSEQPIESLETNIKEAFEIGGTDSDNFIVGDFGHNVVTASNAHENLTTSVDWVSFKRDSVDAKPVKKRQVPQSTDGVFYKPRVLSTKNAASAAVLPLYRLIMNPETGKDAKVQIESEEFEKKDPEVQAQLLQVYPVLSFDLFPEEILQAFERVREGLEKWQSPIFSNDTNKIRVEWGLNLMNNYVPYDKTKSGPGSSKPCKKLVVLTIPKNIFYTLDLSEVLEEKGIQLQNDNDEPYIRIIFNEENILPCLNKILSRLEPMREQKDRNAINEYEKQLKYREGCVFKTTAIPSFVVLGAISAATILFLELSGTTAITSNLWMFPHSAYPFVAAQDIILVVGAALVLAIISSIIGFTAQYLNFLQNDAEKILKEHKEIKILKEHKEIKILKEHKEMGIK